jgi:hypothetical protein
LKRYLEKNPSAGPVPSPAMSLAPSAARVLDGSS